MTTIHEEIAGHAAKEFNGKADVDRQTELNESFRKQAATSVRTPFFQSGQEGESPEREQPPKMRPSGNGFFIRGGGQVPSTNNPAPADSSTNGARKPQADKPKSSSARRSKIAKNHWSDQPLVPLSTICESLQKALAANDWKQTYADLKELANRANYGDAKALTVVRKTLDEHPIVWQTLGDLAHIAESALVAAINADSPVLTESTRRQIAAMRAELLGADATQIEKMAVQRVIMAWLFTQHVDFRCISADGQGKQASGWSKRQELAEKRYQIALKSLKLTREMARHTVRREASAAADRSQSDQKLAEPLAPERKRRAAPKKAAATNGVKKPAGCENTTACGSSNTTSRNGSTGKAGQRVGSFFEAAKAGGGKRNGRAKQTVPS